MKPFNYKGNKKGMMDDLFDLLFTVIVGFFVFFFLNGVLEQSARGSVDVSQQQLARFVAEASAVTQLRVAVQQGKEFPPERVAEHVEQELAKSSVIAGKTIARCEDYETRLDCQQDVLQAGSDGRCRWKKTGCETQRARGQLQ